MPLLHLTLFDNFAPVAFAVLYFINAKILTQDWKFHLKETIFMAVSSLLAAISIILIISLRRVFLDTTDNPMVVPFFNMFGSFAVRTLLFLYFFTIKSYIAKKSLILMFLASMIVLLSEHLIGSVWEAFFPAFFSQYNLWQLILYLCFISLTSIIFTYLFTIATRTLRNMIDQSNRFQTFLLIISIIVLIATQVIAAFRNYQGYTTALLSWNVFFLFILALVASIGSYLYSEMLKATVALQQKEYEEKNFLYYMNEVEQQQSAIRKFKHDYQNILLSLDGFFENDDFTGAKEYYYARIKPASEGITRNSFTLDRLSKIKVKEIKSILAAKLLAAQNIALGIETVFEANAEIDHIPADSVALVRMLGIILDNAIEALAELSEGQLFVACFKEKEAVTFVVQNTCKPHLPKLRELQKIGFSTKGDGRGLGLNNLSELADTCPNVTLWTSVKENDFIQKLIIGEAV